MTTRAAGFVFADHARAPLAQRVSPWVYWAVVAVVVVLAISLMIATITARHRAHAAEHALCVAKLETFYVRNPRLRAGRVVLVDACAEWRTTAP
jgi:hypothetical protein